MDPERIPAPLIHIVADVLSTHHQSHTKISTLFLRCGAPELSTGGNLINRITAWLKESERPFSFLGCVLENFMELDTQSPDWLKGKEKIANALSKYGLAYERGGRIIGGATGAPSRTLDAIIQTRDLPAVRAEFDRAIDTVERDPPTAITSACAIVESLCKVYLNENGLTLPSDQSIRPLWKTVQEHLGLGPKSAVSDDMRQILGGLATVLNGVGDLRTHAGNAHGREAGEFTVEPRHARLAIHAAHTLVNFVLETWTPPLASEVRRDANR